MKKTITSRLEVLLAKIAGKDASLETMTPGVPINLSEKLMLDIADRLDGIAENTPPKVTATDNGDVLTVVDGAWAKAAPSGGGLETIVFVYDNTLNWSCNKSFSEILALVNAGTDFVCIARNESDADATKIEYGGNIDASASNIWVFFTPKIEEGTSKITIAQTILSLSPYVDTITDGSVSYKVATV